MPIGTKTQERTDSAVTIKILAQTGTYAHSMEVLNKNGLRPLTYQDALVHAPELIEKLKEKWFWLTGEGPHKGGVFTFNEKGQLEDPIGNVTPDRKVLVYLGMQPPCLAIGSNSSAERDGRRFVLALDSGQLSAAPVIVGLKTGKEEESPRSETPRSSANGMVKVPARQFSASQKEWDDAVAAGYINTKKFPELAAMLRK